MINVKFIFDVEDSSKDINITFEEDNGIKLEFNDYLNNSTSRSGDSLSITSANKNIGILATEWEKFQNINASDIKKITILRNEGIIKEITNKVTSICYNIYLGTTETNTIYEEIKLSF